MKYRFKAKLWKYRPKDPENTIGLWFFITVPKKYTKEIKLFTDDAKKGFGSVKVEATIGKSTWQTSVFPDSKLDSYLLPVKKAIRNKEHITDGKEVAVVLKLLV